MDKKIIAESKDVGSATVFSPIVDNQVLKFEYRKNKFTDINTKSIWNISGKCINGKLKGKSLSPLPHGNHFAFAALFFYPDSKIYK